MAIFNFSKQEEVTQDRPQEGISEKLPLLSVDTPDGEIVERIDKFINGGINLYEKMAKKSEINRKYWKAEQLDGKKMRDYQAKIVNNIVFRDLETMLPIITKNTPSPDLRSSNKEFDRAVEKMMGNRWEVMDKMLEKNRLAVRALFLDLLGVIKYKWDAETNDIDYEFVKTRNIIVDPKAFRPDHVSGVVEYIGGQSIKDVVEIYPEAKKDLYKEFGISGDDDYKLGNKITYIEYWSPDMVVWKYKDIILDKKKNPNWDWEGEVVVNEMGEEVEQFYNLWKKPRVPYLFLQAFTLGEHMYSSTSLIEQTVALQDAVNKRKRQISDNADEANGILVGSGDVIDKEEFAKIDNEPNLKIWLQEGSVREGLNRISGNPLQAYVFNDMVHSETAIDNIWGIHAITRGESQNGQTATEAVLQQKQDYGRIDDIVKAYEDFNEQYYQSVFQMLLIHGDDEQVYSFLDDDDLTISREDIIIAYSTTKKRKLNEATGEMEVIENSGDFRPPVIMVKRGSTLPVNDVARRAEALQLLGAGRISTVDLYEKLGWANAREMAINAILEQAAPQRLYPELQEEGEGGISEGAAEDFARFVDGRATPANREVKNPETAGKHLESHRKQLKSEEFAKMSDEQKQAFLVHIRSETEVAKQMMQQLESKEEGK